MTIAEAIRETEVPSVVADGQGMITYVNARFESVFGWSKDEIVGKSLTIIIPRTLRDAHQLGFSRFLMTGKPTLLGQALSLRSVTRDGREFEAEHFIVAEQRDGQWAFAATIRPLP